MFFLSFFKEFCYDVCLYFITYENEFILNTTLIILSFAFNVQILDMKIQITIYNPLMNLI